MFDAMKSFFNPPSVSAHEVKNNINKGSSILLDVRETKERTIHHIPGSIHIPVGELKNRLNELMPNKDKKIITYCASGTRSAMATAILNENGFTALNMTGGMSAYL
jgi:rhodanese-related sulfurtransferase